MSDRRQASHRWLHRIMVMVAAVVILTALGPAPLARAEGGLEVLGVGWGDTVVSNTWSPVRVRVTGESADANALVEVLLKAQYQSSPRGTPVAVPVVSYGQEVALPAGAAKDVTIWVPAENGMVGTVQLRIGDRVVAEEEIRFRGLREPFWPLVGVLAESPVIARKVAEVELPLQGLPFPLTVASLTPEEVPAAADRLEAFGAIVVQGNAPATLTGEQRQAIRQWILEGGHLLVVGGPDAPRAAAVLPADTVSLTFGEVDPAADIADLAKWIGTASEELPAAPALWPQASAGHVLAGSPDRALAWRTALGDGTVTVLAVDPSLQPLSTWQGTSALFRKALEPALPGPNENEKIAYARLQQYGQGTPLQYVVDALPPEAFPDWRTVALVLGGFALAMGPIGHFVLWRKDRRELIWILLPASALALTIGMYFVGVGREGRDVLANVIGHVRIDPTSGGAKQTVAAGFFAPTRSHLEITVPDDVLVRTGGQWEGNVVRPGGRLAPALDGPPARIVSGRDTRVSFDAGQWTMRSVSYSRSLGDEVGSLTAHLGIEGGLIKGTIRNDTPYRLEDAAIVVGWSVARLGTLAPGQTAQVVLDPLAATASDAARFGGQSLSLQLFGQPRNQAAANGSMVATVRAPVPVPAVRVPAGAAVPVSVGMPNPYFEQLEIPRDPETQRRVRLLDSVINSIYQFGMFSPDQFTMPLTFIAFTRDAIGTDSPEAGHHPTHHLTLIEQPLSLEFAPGPFSLPSALIPGQMTIESSNGLGGGGNGVLTWTELHSGSIIYSFRPAVPPNARIETLTIGARQVGATTPTGPSRRPAGLPPGPSDVARPAEAGVFTIYNWQSGSWDQLPVGDELVRIAPAQPYVSSDGRVHVRVTAPPDHLVRFLAPELSVEGTVTE